jgi:hypothetical protein
MHPLIGGIVLAQFLSRADNEAEDDTSHLDVEICTPKRAISATNSVLASDFTPVLDGKIRYLAPLLAIHIEIDRPIPPSPPAIRYDALASKFQSSGRRINF